jgi:hypothetical protein
MELLFVSIYTIAESFRLGSAIFPKNSSESILAVDFLEFLMVVPL